MINSCRKKVRLTWHSCHTGLLPTAVAVSDEARIAPTNVAVAGPVLQTLRTAVAVVQIGAVIGVDCFGEGTIISIKSIAHHKPSQSLTLRNTGVSVADVSRIAGTVVGVIARLIADALGVGAAVGQLLAGLRLGGADDAVAPEAGLAEAVVLALQPIRPTLGVQVAQRQIATVVGGGGLHVRHRLALVAVAVVAV